MFADGSRIGNKPVFGRRNEALLAYIFDASEVLFGLTAVAYSAIDPR